MSDCATWWFDHVGETYMYVAATKAGDERMQAGAVDKLVEGAGKWGDLLGIPEAGKLMGEHVSAVKVLADGAFTKDQDAVDLSVETLLINARHQADLYAINLDGFPTEEFGRLFVTHITSTGGYVLALAAGDVPDFKSNYNTVIQNRNQLARFWWLVCSKRK